MDFGRRVLPLASREDNPGFALQAATWPVRRLQIYRVGRAEKRHPIAGRLRTRRA
nr:MAG TPA: hypothetical protein [Caudoviricetes sp.]